MAASPGVAFRLDIARLQFVTIHVPLAPAQPDTGAEQHQVTDVLPAPLPARFAQLSQALAGVRALNSAALPFAAHALGHAELRVVTLKQHVGGVFKLLWQHQASCGTVIGKVKAHVSVTPLPAPDLEQACACGLLASLLPRGWWQLDEDRLLGSCLLQPTPDGSAQACASITLRVHVEPAGKPTRLYLLVKPEQVEFRHPACRPGASLLLQQRSASLAGAVCCLLPDMRPALIQRLLPADAATLARLRPVWAAYGMPLSLGDEADGAAGGSAGGAGEGSAGGAAEGAVEGAAGGAVEGAAAGTAAGASGGVGGCLVEVSLDCDPDAPTYAYPASRVLGAAGLHSVASRLASPGVQAVLARLRDDLAATPIKFLGPDVKLAAQAHEWYPDGLPPPPPRSRHLVGAEAAAPALAFVTARQHAEQSKHQGSGGSTSQLALGALLDVAALGALGEEAGGVGQHHQQQQDRQRQKRPHFVAAPKLQAALEAAKQALSQADTPTSARSVVPGSRMGAGGGTAASSQQATVQTQATTNLARVPFALRQAAAAAVSTGASQSKQPPPAIPVFKMKAAATPVSQVRSKPAAAAAGKKRPPAPKQAAVGAAKRTKGTPGSAAASAAGGSCAASPAVSLLPALPGPQATAAEAEAATGGSMPGSEATATAMQGKSKVAVLPGLEGGTASAATAPLKQPAKPRAKASDVDIAAAVSKVQAAHAGGTLVKVTIPELKAFLRSVKQPVGGKKGELEERVRAWLGPAPTAAVALAGAGGAGE